ncbi:S-layer homology domain-containing protein [Tumebacillus permanentifrigoris]|uniref:S-layer family protein n=1 Tax=Tumebacillus permanentifrigoris TaxID=378543 RepID=A0A316D590_9BACL|nr:S-layer homology domain-containing protein [Tumebacillus permanentifrigoris]PWK08370.1 S-layer family protein [Tumebacillus permanentifrigoris]
MPTPILGQPEATAFQLRNYLHQVNPSAPDYSTWYLTIGRKYGVRGDIAFCQSLLETNYWRFGNLVLPEQNNFAGIGAVGGAERGNVFPTPQAGIEAQIQHLYAYSSSLPLPANTVQIDPRFGLVTRGIAPAFENLSGRWASDANYGAKIIGIYKDLIATQGALNPPTTGGGTTAPSTGTGQPTSGTGTTPATPTPPVAPVPVNQRFADIDANAWYTPYVQRIVDLGIMRGEEDNRFHPNDTATRAELVAALYQLYQTLQKNQT